MGGLILIENRLVDKICCLDQNIDTFELIESICFNTVVLDLKAINNGCVTHIIINQQKANKLSDSLKSWAEGGSNENS